MKKYLLLWLFLFGGLSFLTGQSPIVFDADGKNITNTTVNLTFAPIFNVKKLDFFLNNPGNAPMVVSMRKVEVSVLDGTDNDFCFAGKCYSPSVFVAPDKMTIAPGSTIGQNESYSQYYPNGLIGSSTIKYEFFSETGAFPTVFVNVVFTATDPTNLVNLPFYNVFVSDPFPNPARGHTTIEYRLTPEVRSGRVIIRSLTGQVVQTTPINVAANSIRIDTSFLNAGMYFYSIELNNQVFVSKRLIVGK